MFVKPKDYSTNDHSKFDFDAKATVLALLLCLFAACTTFTLAIASFMGELKTHDVVNGILVVSSVPWRFGFIFSGICLFTSLASWVYVGASKESGYIKYLLIRMTRLEQLALLIAIGVFASIALMPFIVFINRMFGE